MQMESTVTQILQSTTFQFERQMGNGFPQNVAQNRCLKIKFTNNSNGSNKLLKSNCIQVASWTTSHDNDPGSKSTMLYPQMKLRASLEWL